MKLHNAKMRANQSPDMPKAMKDGHFEVNYPVMKQGPKIEASTRIDDSNPTLESELSALLNPPYGSKQWAEQTESMFGGNIVQTHLKKERSLLEKIKPRSKGRHEAPTPSRIKRARNLFSSIMASLLVEDPSLSYLETAQKTKSAPRHEYTPPPKQKYESSKKKRSKLLAPIGVVAFTALALGGGLILKNDNSSKPIEKRQKATLETDVVSSTPISVGIAEPAVAIKANPEVAKITENNPAAPTNIEAGVETTPKIVITIEKGGNIWQATKAELQKSNPKVTNPVVANYVNRMILQNNINNPDLVFEGQHLTVET